MPQHRYFKNILEQQQQRKLKLIKKIKEEEKWEKKNLNQHNDVMYVCTCIRVYVWYTGKSWSKRLYLLLLFSSSSSMYCWCVFFFFFGYKYQQDIKQKVFLEISYSSAGPSFFCTSFHFVKVRFFFSFIFILNLLLLSLWTILAFAVAINFKKLLSSLLL